MLNYKNESIKANIITKIESLQDYIEKNIPSRGDTSETCQQRCILNELCNVEYAVNGLSDNDFIED